MNTGTRAVMWIVGILFLAFGLMTLETALSIWRHEVYFALKLLDTLVSSDFTWGGEGGYAAVPQILSQYYAKSGRIVLHIALGGVVVGIGISQFIPALRRSRPALHRRLGIVVASAMALSMAGAIAYLVSARLDSIFSGPTFYMFLWGLALLALFTLLQAGLAIASRDFRSHMVWMGACFATFMTAPLLRMDWVLLGLWAPMSLQRANAAIAPMVLVQALLLVLLWLSLIGDKDLPARKPAGTAWLETRWPRWVLQVMALMTVIVALLAVTVLPTSAWLWALPTAWAAWHSLDAWEDWTHGFAPQPSFLLALALSGCAAIWVGFDIATQTLDGFTWAFFWKCLGALQLLALLLAARIVPNSLGRNAWGAFSLFVLWAPAWMPLLLWALEGVGMSPYETLISSATLAIGGMCTAGVATALGAKLRRSPVR